MNGRRQQKLGWIAGWLGGFVWVPILAVVSFAQGSWIHGTVGLLIAGVACVTIFLFGPWRYPKTQYRLLMVPVYVLLFVALAWGVWALGDSQQMGLNSWWSLFLLFPALLPVWIAGDRCWDDGAAEPHAADT